MDVFKDVGFNGGKPIGAGLKSCTSVAVDQRQCAKMKSSSRAGRIPSSPSTAHLTIQEMRASSAGLPADKTSKYVPICSQNGTRRGRKLLRRRRRLHARSRSGINSAGLLHMSTLVECPPAFSRWFCFCSPGYVSRKGC